MSRWVKEAGCGCLVFEDTFSDYPREVVNSSGCVKHGDGESFAGRVSREAWPDVSDLTHRTFYIPIVERVLEAAAALEAKETP